MTGRTLTDAQLSSALRAHLPEQAPAGLRQRVIEATESTAQSRSFPSFLGALCDADPVSRRRSLLIAAALLLALALGVSAGVGAWRDAQHSDLDRLSLEPPDDLPAFVLSSYERLLELPPVALTWHDSDSAKGRVYVDRSGAVRFDRFPSAEATEPSGYRILNGNRVSGMALVEAEAVWVEPGHEAVDDNAREYIRGVINGGNAGPGCELSRDQDEAGNETAATGWRYVGVESVAGRPTHHVACAGELSLDVDLWLDIETRLILRTREPLTDDAGQAIPGQFGFIEITEIAFGEQPAALFEPPEGVRRMSAEAYTAYVCARDLPNEMTPGTSDCPAPEAEATPLPPPTPTPTVRPSLAPRPSGPAGPLAWTESSPTEDWPAPVRPEPTGGASVEPVLLNIVPVDAESCCKVFELGRDLDPRGDSGPVVIPWVDINMVSFCGRTCLQVWVPGSPPNVDPTEQWIAYGLIVDDDGDGVGDRRFGIDNVPMTAGGEREYRTWITDLHSGRTESAIGDSYGLGDFVLEGTSYPVDAAEPNGIPDCSAGSAQFRFAGGDIAGGGTFGVVPAPFYAWASVIDRGRVVATDYAPDTGWLQPSSTAPPSAPDTGEVWWCPPTIGAPGR
jgi:hypothetical protein